MTHVPFLVSLMGPAVLQIAFYYLFMVVLGLLCWAEAFYGLGEWGLLLTWCMGFLSQCLLLLQSKGSRQAGRLQEFAVCGLSSCGHRLSFSEACGIFLEQGLNPGPCIDTWILNH